MKRRIAIEEIQINELATKIRETIFEKVCSKLEITKTSKLHPNFFRILKERQEMTETETETDSFKIVINQTNFTYCENCLKVSFSGG